MDLTYINDDRQTVARSLMVWMDDEQKRSIETALQALTLYQQAFTNYQQMRTQSQQSEAAMVEQARTMLALVEESKAQQEQAMTADSGQALFMLGAMGLAAVVIGLLAALVISRSIVSPLQQTVAFAQRIAAGDLTQDLPQNRRDEPGQLMAAMQSMSVSLRTLVGRIGSGVRFC